MLAQRFYLKLVIWEAKGLYWTTQEGSFDLGLLLISGVRRRLGTVVQTWYWNRVYKIKSSTIKVITFSAESSDIPSDINSLVFLSTSCHSFENRNFGEHGIKYSSLKRLKATLVSSELEPMMYVSRTEKK